MAKELTKDERIIVRGYKEGLKNIRNDINLLYEKHAKDGKLSTADLSKYNRLTNLEKNIADNLKTAYDVQVRTTKKAVKGAFESAFYYGTFELEQEAKMNLMFGLLKKEAVNAVVEGPNRWPQIAKGHTKLTNAKIRDQIMQGVVQGKDVGQVTKAIAKEMNIAASKACRIVRTETHRAQNQGSLDSYTEAYKKGVLIQKVWVATLDDRTRDSHRVMDGQVVEVYEDFIMPGDIKASAPGLSGSASGDINCRCTIRAEVVGFTPQARRARGDGIIPQQTYQQWAKSKGIPFNKDMADEVKKLLEARAAEIAQVGDINLNTIYNEFEPELLPYAPTQAEHKCLMDTGSTKDMINNKTKFSNYMVDFTAGESGFSQLSTKILKGEHNFKGTLTNDEAFALNVLRLIDEAPQRSAPVYRLEELASHNKNLREGDTIIYGMRSFSRSKEWVNQVVAGEYDVDFSSPVLLEVKNCRAINVEPFSYFKEQEESLTAGHFKISSVKNMKIKGQIVKHIVLEQTRVL
jgi:SPP1 gp7 family putative phage head morphogenesis protein